MDEIKKDKEDVGVDTNPSGETHRGGISLNKGTATSLS